ncbi:hypothetical protein [Neoroseomonas lacus]|uniref:Uncharacterized protein n=1 Tax=Neoroseomonas lacus TaxID=287609 RepID=A0A917KN94_9PROT|nr:hypothetical protein [Neoroseomonas lacus]GGJ22016.1 hypothetical protein GCM10011320_31570 [Neoroseomonas lacus]
MPGAYALSVKSDLSDRLIDLEVEAAGEAAAAAVDTAWWSRLATLLLVLGLLALGAFWVVAILPGRSASGLLVASIGAASLLIVWSTTNPSQAAQAARQRGAIWTDLTRQARQQRRAAGEGQEAQLWATYQWLLAQRDALRSGRPMPSQTPVFAPDAAEVDQ